ncbi:hypothetical protein V8B55DRAFT_1136209 [Mucor lusitanicus]
MLKTIENLAVNDLKKAYAKTLSYQTKYALTENEVHFEVYACVLLKLLYQKKDILSSPSNTRFTEADCVINVWSKIFQFVLEDSANNLFCKWFEFIEAKQPTNLLTALYGGENRWQKIHLTARKTASKAMVWQSVIRLI